MSKIITSLLFIFVINIPNISASNITYNIKSDRIEFKLIFSKGYSSFDMLESDKSIIFSFETSENMKFKPADFFDLPIKSAMLLNDSFRKKLIINFEESFIKPIISKSNKDIKIVFPFPSQSTYLNRNENISTNQTDSNKLPTVPPTGSYFKMLFGLSTVLIIILFLYWIVKSYFKKQIFTDIPGSGRLLGNVDIAIRKSLFFYELGDSIYIIGVTDNGMNLIDKVVDEVEITKIKAGFNSRREFNGYMNFFKRKNELDNDISTSNAIVEERLKTLRKK